MVRGEEDSMGHLMSTSGLVCSTHCGFVEDFTSASSPLCWVCVRRRRAAHLPREQRRGGGGRAACEGPAAALLVRRTSAA